MKYHKISQGEVIERRKFLPSFPLVVSRILATIDDPEANLNVLVNHVEHDPVITARVLSRANIAANRTHNRSEIRDIYSAISLIGMGPVREMALISSVGGFIEAIPSSARPENYWKHSIAVGVCCEELAHHTHFEFPEAALIAGLLHDIGQLWLFSFNAGDFREIWRMALTHNIGIEEAERERFSVDHTTIGAWLAEHWSLPTSISAAIRYHHAPNSALHEPLVPLVHVAEVLSNALDLADQAENRVTTISSRACRTLGLTWNEEIRPLFGRIDARSRHANAMFQ